MLGLSSSTFGIPKAAFLKLSLHCGNYCQLILIFSDKLFHWLLGSFRIIPGCSYVDASVYSGPFAVFHCVDPLTLFSGFSATVHKNISSVVALYTSKSLLTYVDVYVVVSFLSHVIFIFPVNFISKHNHTQHKRKTKITWDKNLTTMYTKKLLLM